MSGRIETRILRVGVVVAALVASAGPIRAQSVRTDLWVTNGTVNAVVEAGGVIYIGGVFTQVGPASGGAVPLDASTGLPLALPKVAGIVSVVAPDGAGGWYVGGLFTHVGGVPRSNLAHIRADHTVSAWNPNADGRVYALAVSGSTVYAGGYFTSIGGQLRNRIAALDATSGLATAWDPNPDGVVYALAMSGSTVYAGGGFYSIGGQPQAYVAAIAADIPTATLLARFQATAGDDGVELRWSFSDPARVAAAAVERAEHRDGPWSAIHPELRAEYEVTVALDRTAEPGRSYFYRLIVQLTDGSEARFGPVSASVDARITESALTQVGPNPTGGGLEIQYLVGRGGRVRLDLVDVAGRVVATLADQVQPPGRYLAAWDGRHEGRRVPSGLYVVRLTAPDGTSVRKLATIR